MSRHSLIGKAGAPTPPALERVDSERADPPPLAMERSREARRVALGAELAGHIASLRRYARALARHPADADDLVQETLKRALHYDVGRRRVDNLRAYLMRILHNVRRDEMIRQARAGATVDVDTVEIVSEEATVGERIACGEAMEALHRLPEKQREVMMLVAVEGVSYREAAQILDLPIGTIMSRLNRARAALRRMLGMEEGPSPD